MGLGPPSQTGPCWALKGLGPKSTGPVGHSSQPALLGTQGSWPPKFNRPLLNTQASLTQLAQSQPALMGALSLSWPGPPKLNQHCLGTQRLMGKNLEFFPCRGWFSPPPPPRCAGWFEGGVGEWTEKLALLGTLQGSGLVLVPSLLGCQRPGLVLELTGRRRWSAPGFPRQRRPTVGERKKMRIYGVAPRHCGAMRAHGRALGHEIYLSLEHVLARARAAALALVWPKVNRPCWALKGLGPTGPKSTGPVGHSKGRLGPQVNRPCWALKGPWPKVNRPCWALKSTGPLLGTQGSWPPSQPALLNTQASSPNWPKVNRP